jgi:predicted DCC family thiol-disulfide oxidoreductase YuxK
VSGEPTYIVYDGDCPFCSQFVALVRLREAAGPVVLLNAREDHPIVRYVKQRGVVLNQEMAMVAGDQVYAGADCMNRIALMSTNSGLFNKLNALVFSSRPVSKFMYPILRAGRNLSLKVLGRSPLEI